MAKELHSGADVIAHFISEFCFQKVFLVTGGACAFIVDAIGRNENLRVIPFQHEQAAAMAADAVWRTSSQIGVTVATSGPGATNLITGIACSWFDSIPSIHITGQVNRNESKKALGVNVRQAGFQETDIVDMVSSITKKAVYIESLDQLIETLPKLLELALSGRMGPVLIDVPMNVQKDALNSYQIEKIKNWEVNVGLGEILTKIDEVIKKLLKPANRPIVLLGAGAALCGKATQLQEWCETNRIPYVSSWGAMPYLDRSASLYQGHIGVYGSRHGNYAIQNADTILVFGSRLDNRQRTGNPYGFAPFAEIIVFDVDKEELNKYNAHANYQTIELDLRNLPKVLPNIDLKPECIAWIEALKISKEKLDEGFSLSSPIEKLNPYSAVRTLQSKFEESSIVVSDCGANLCWVYQSYLPDTSFLFTAGGNSPMGYSVPAAIGASMTAPNKNVYCFIGDGGFQMNIQELQTIVHNNLNVKILIQNNFGYGIIKQFQDAYFESRYFATGEGYSSPNFEKIAAAYGFKYSKISSMREAEEFTFSDTYEIVELIHDPNTLITPKTEMNRFIHDQFPYIEDGMNERMFFVYPNRPSNLNGIVNPTV